MMNKKRLSALFLGCALSAVMIFSGCGSILDEVNLMRHSEDTIEEDLNLGEPVSSEDSTIRLTSHWYNEAGEKLAGATVTITSDGSELFTGVTDENGLLATCTFPANTKILYTVTDASGAALGSSEAAYIVSEDYTVISMFTKNGESGIQKIQIPSGKTDIVAAMFIDSNKKISHSNITINRNTSAEQAETVSAEDAAAAEAPAEETAPADEAAPAEEATDGEAAASEETGEEDTSADEAADADETADE